VLQHKRCSGFFFMQRTSHGSFVRKSKNVPNYAVLFVLHGL